MAKLVPELGVRRVTGSQSAIEARMQQPPFPPGLNMPSETYFPLSSQQLGFSQSGVGINMPMAAFPPHFSVSPPALSTRDGLQHLAILGVQGNLSPTYDHIMPVSFLCIFEQGGRFTELVLTIS